METFTWIISIAGVLGVAGTIAALVLVPAVAMPILQNVIGLLLRCKPCLYVLVVSAMCVGSWWFGHHQAAVECRAEELAAKLAAQAEDLDAAKKAATDEQKRSKLIEAAANDQRQKDADYIATLQARPACALDQSDLGSGLGGVPNRPARPARAKPAVPAR